MKITKKKSIFIVLAAIVVLGSISWILWGPTPQNEITFENTKVKRGDISTSITATGTVKAITSVDVGTQVTGLVSKLYVDYNSTVKKGQLLAELDKTNLENSLNSARSTMRSNRTEYEYQTNNYKRIKALHDKKLVSESDYDTAADSYHKAKDTYDVSKNDYSKAQTNLSYASIYSPINGVVLSKEVEEGQTVTASMSTPTLFVIAQNLKKMQVIANVDEADIGNVKVGQRVSFTVDAYPESTFNGNVTQVRQEATTTNNVVTYEVVINAPNEDLKLKPGLTANVTIYTLDKKNILTIPSKALRFSPDFDLIGKEDQVINAKNMKTDETHKILWKRIGKKFIAIPVVVGISDGTNTEIISGIKENENVILDATSGVMPGQTQSSGSPSDNSSKSGTTSESSPFAPTPPGGNKKK